MEQQPAEDTTTVTPEEAWQLLNARLAVARLGERGLLAWWQTDDVLGEDGAYVAARSLPKTHGAGRARIAMAVARNACDRRFPMDGAQHLFALRASIEERVEACVSGQLGDASWWQEVLEPLEALTEPPTDLASWLIEMGVSSKEAAREVENLSLGPDHRSLHLPSASSWAKQIELLAAGFARGGPRELVVPYIMRAEGSASG